jgi:hypothetical protein
MAKHVVVPLRTLHLVDVENLLGAHHRHAGSRDLANLRCRYDKVARRRRLDPVILGVNPSLLAVEAKTAWPTSLLTTGRGRDGADRALLARAEEADIPGRFWRVAIGSGDAAFAALAAWLRSEGVVVDVISRPEAIASALRSAASRLTLLPPAVDLDERWAA